MSHSHSVGRIPLPVSILGSEWAHFTDKPPAESAGLIYAIADIHGCHLLLEKMLDVLLQDMCIASVSRPEVIFLGDYIDRGPDTKRVINDLIKLTKLNPSPRYTFLMGNHEQWLLDFIQGRPVLPVWGCQGGLETLVSYGIPESMIQRGIREPVIAKKIRRLFLDILPVSHQHFFSSLQYFTAIDDYFFCHAGVDPRLPLNFQRQHSLIWIRDEFLRSTKDFGKVVVHGHTPSSQVESLPNRINIDSGIYFRGVLRCVVLEGSSRYLIQVE